jgi:hypothetical protein
MNESSFMFYRERVFFMFGNNLVIYEGHNSHGLVTQYCNELSNNTVGGYFSFTAKPKILRRWSSRTCWMCGNHGIKM